MSPQPFSATHMYWVGMNLPTGTAAELDEFQRFYNEIHGPEVLRFNPGFQRLHRYEILEADPRGVLGPTFLAMYEADDEAAARYLALEDGPAELKPRYSSGPRIWEGRQLLRRMIWRKIPDATNGAPPKEDAAAIFVVGMSPPGDDPATLAEFNSFYTSIHVPEVVAAGGYQRGTRYELRRALLHPDQDCPRYCAIYEGNDEVAEAVAIGAVHPTVPDPSRNLSSGPDVWATRTTVWRHVYRSMGVNLEPKSVG